MQTGKGTKAREVEGGREREKGSQQISFAFIVKQVCVCVCVLRSVDGRYAEAKEMRGVSFMLSVCSCAIVRA